MATWPATLPQNPFDQDGATYEPSENIIRSDTETGPAKMRRRFTGKNEKLSFSMVLTPTQWAALDTFYETTLQAVGKFQWIDFRTKAAANYRFKKKPSQTYWGEDSTGVYWQVSVDLELIP